MSRQSKMPEQAIGFRVEGLTGLSKSATQFVHQHPKQARMAVAATSEAVAVQYEAEDSSSAFDVPEALKVFVVHRPLGSDMIGVSEAAVRVTHSTASTNIRLSRPVTPWSDSPLETKSLTRSHCASDRSKRFKTASIRKTALNRAAAPLGSPIFVHRI